MIDLTKFFKISFADDKNITDQRMCNFTADHMSKMILNNTTHQFDALMAATKPLLEALKKEIAGKDTSVADRIVSTSTLVNVEENFKTLVHTAEATVLTLQAKGSTGYLEFFPISLTDYTRANRDKIGEYIDFFIARFTAHPEYGAAILASFTALNTLFLNTDTDHTTKAGTVKSMIDEVSAERIALNQQVQINVLSIAIMYIGQPEKIKVFFDTSLLYYHGHTVFSPGTVYPVKVVALHTKEAGVGGLPEQTIKVVNEKLSNIQIWADSTKKKPIPTSKAVTLAKGNTGIYKMADISNKPTDKYLFIKNLDVTTAVVTVEIVSAQIVPPFPTPTPAPISPA